MRIITKENISFNQWVEQSSRFTSGLDSLLVRNLPQNTDTSGKAEIHIHLKQPLIIDGFYATITYIQNYTNTVIVNEESIVNNEKLPIIKYNLSIDYTTVSSLLNQVDSLVDVNLIGLDRIKQQLVVAILADVVAKNTFNGLLSEDYEVYI